MLAALLLLGLLPLAALPMMTGADADDAPDPDEAEPAGEGDGSLLDEILDGEAGQVYSLSAEPGITDLPGFSPGEDILEFDMTAVAGDMYYELHSSEAGATFAITAGPEEVATVRFPGLDEVPAGDIFLKLADESGGSYEMSLAEVMAEPDDGAGEAALEPLPPDAPDVPGPEVPGDTVLEPLPDAPDTPGPVDGGEPLDPLPPDAPETPVYPLAGAALDPLPPDAPDAPGSGETGGALDPLSGDAPDAPGPAETGAPLDAEPATASLPPAVEVENFRAGEDFLRLTLPPDGGFDDSAEITVAASGDGSDGLVSVNGQLVAILRGAPDVTVADVRAETGPSAL